MWQLQQMQSRGSIQSTSTWIVHCFLSLLRSRPSQCLVQRLNQFLHELAQRIASVTNEPPSPRFLLQRLAAAVQRGNAVAVMGSARVWNTAQTCIFLSTVCFLIIILYIFLGLLFFLCLCVLIFLFLAFNNFASHFV